MRAIVSDGGTWRLEERYPPPDTRPGWAVLRPTRVAVGPRVAGGGASARFVPGDEFCGMVEELDPADEAVRERWLARRVAVDPTIVCGECERCRSGLAEHCRGRTRLGSPGCDGGLAERVAVPIANLHAIGDLDDDRAAMSAVAGRGLAAAGLAPRGGSAWITVLGDSAEALIAAQVLARENPRTRVVAEQPRTAELCERWGLKHRPAGDAGKREDQDAVIVASGRDELLALAAMMARPRGVIVVMAGDGGVPASALVRGELQVIGVQGGSAAAGLAAISRGAVDVLGLVSARASLRDGPGILRAAAAEAPGLLIVDAD